MYSKPTVCLQNLTRGPAAKLTGPDIPGRPWSEVMIDKELGADQSGQYQSGQYYCVQIAVDCFTKWAELVPLHQHGTKCVAGAFSCMCLKWGAPDDIHTDNGTEFANAIVAALLQLFRIKVCTSTVCHPASQGSAERFNQMLLTMERP